VSKETAFHPRLAPLTDQWMDLFGYFAPSVVTVPPSVSLRKVDLAIELQILSFYQQRKIPSGDGQRSGAPRTAEGVL